MLQQIIKYYERIRLVNITLWTQEHNLFHIYKVTHFEVLLPGSVECYTQSDWIQWESRIWQTLCFQRRNTVLSKSTVPKQAHDSLSQSTFSYEITELREWDIITIFYTNKSKNVLNPNCIVPNITVVN